MCVTWLRNSLIYSLNIPRTGCADIGNERTRAGRPPTGRVAWQCSPSPPPPPPLRKGSCAPLLSPCSLRVTDGPTMDVVEMVLVGRVNKSIVTLINQAGGNAVGMCGKDGRLLMARQMVEKDIGFVGEVNKVNSSVLRALMSEDLLPVVATVAQDENGQALNVNADIAAGEIAAAVGAEKLILMTDVPGVMKDKDDVSTLYKTLSIRDSRELIEEGVIAGGMIPKVECCVRSLAQGVGAAHIIDGRQQHSLLQELLTDEGVGTMITG